MKDVYPNFDEYAPWVKKLLVLKLFAPGSGPSWMDHHLLVHRERRGQMLGSLDREAITEMRTKWFEMALPYLDNPAVSDGERAKLRKDLDAVKWAGICLDRLIDNDALSTLATPKIVAEDTQANPFNEPIEGSPASGDNDEARRGETLQPAGNEKDLELQFAQVAEQAPQSAEFEISGEVPPAPLAAVQQSGHLVDPAFIHTREQFLEACQIAAQRVIEAQNVWEAEQMADLGGMLEALAQTKRLGKELELWAKSIRLRAFFKVAQFQIQNGQNGEKIADPTEKRLVHDLKKLTEDSFEKILSKGMEKGNLADKLFRVSASKSTKATTQTKADQLDPRRFFLSFICDMRANPTYYSQVGAAKFLDDPRILENLDPIEEHYVAFSIAIIGALRARRATASATKA